MLFMPVRMADDGSDGMECVGYAADGDIVGMGPQMDKVDNGMGDGGRLRESEVEEQGVRMQVVGMQDGVGQGSGRVADEMQTCI